MRQLICELLQSRVVEPRLVRKVEEALTIGDLWEMAAGRVPPVVFEYFRGAAGDKRSGELTLRANSLDWQTVGTTAFGARDLKVNTATQFAGFEMKVPWMIAPVGSLALLYPNADALAAKVAGEFGTIMTQSTLSGVPMESVTAASSGDCFFQLYLCGGKDSSIKRIQRAKKAGFKALVVTIDTAVAGSRVEHARMKPVQALTTIGGNLRVAPQMISRLPWLCGHYAGGGMIKFVNVELDGGTLMPYTDIGAQLEASAVTWEHLAWIIEEWKRDNPNGKVIVKGVHCAEDAQLAEKLGVDGIIWSNHGGRQQDGVPSALQILAQEMPKMRGSKMSFMVDGGIRDGRSVLIALTYGVSAVGLGRVTVAGIGAGGYYGLHKAFRLMNAEFVRSMKLVGVKSVAEIIEHGAGIRREEPFRSHVAQFHY